MRWLGVGGGIADDTLDEGLEDLASLVVDGSGDALDTTAAGEAADGPAGDAAGVLANGLLHAGGGTLGASGLLTLSHD